MGANDVHGALMLVGFVTPGCYKATVNEPETIIEAQPFRWVRSHSDTSELRAFGFRWPVVPHIERS